MVFAIPIALRLNDNVEKYPCILSSVISRNMRSPISVNPIHGSATWDAPAKVHRSVALTRSYRRLSTVCSRRSPRSPAGDVLMVNQSHPRLRSCAWRWSLLDDPRQRSAV